MGPLTAHLVVVAAAATQTPAPDPGRPLEAYLTPALLTLLGSGAVAAVLTAIATSLRATAGARRERYAAATGLLVARIEYPYRIRRRTSDDAETLTQLAERGHDLQERLAEARAWVTAESPIMGEVYDACVEALDQPFKAAARQAWNEGPVKLPQDMNLNGFGPGDLQDVVTTMECALGYRFGVRRLLPQWAMRRLLQRCGCLDKPGVRAASG